MPEAGYLLEVIVILLAAVVSVVVFQRLRLGSVLGYLVAGTVIGPTGLAFVSDSETTRALGELGVVFLLFEIGLELPIERLRSVWRPALLGGGFQVGITVLVFTASEAFFGLAWPSALVIGACVSMSSTAIVLGLLSDEGQVDAPGGQLAIAILLLQDLAIVPFLLIVPLLASGAGNFGEIGWAVGRMLLGLAVVGFGVWFLVPRLLDRVAQNRGGELFSLFALLIVLGSAFLAEELGLTLAVGAFLAGVAASSSPYAQ